LSFIKDKFAHIPEGAGALFFIQIFATLGFGVLQSSLVLYATKHLQFSAAQAAAIMGVFGAFNYGLHLFGGYLGGRFLSNRNLFVGGMVLQVIGCAFIAGGTAALMYWGLALFLTGSGLNVTCLNMMLTQRFEPEDIRREGAFLWNYAGMNVGFAISFLVAGHYENLQDYTAMFLFATVGNFAAIVIAAINWKAIADLDTPLLHVNRTQFLQRFAVGIAILVGLVPVVWLLLQYPDYTEVIVYTICTFVGLYLAFLAMKHHDARERNNMWAYLILTLGSLVFWALYQMTTNGLIIFCERNVNRVVGSYEIAPQWIQFINTAVIVLGGPTMSALFVRLRARGWNIDVPKQFSISLILMSLGFLILPIGIKTAGADGMVAFQWIFWSYIFQSVGELLISPVGYAMIGRLAPKQYQGIMMGSWMLVTGVASLMAGDFSKMVPDVKGVPASVTNPAYSDLFMKLGLGCVVVAVALVVLIPTLRRLIKDKSEVDAAPLVLEPAN